MEPVMASQTPTDPSPDRDRRDCCRDGAGARLWIGLALIGIGAFFALASLSGFYAVSAHQIWPLILIVFGVGITVRSRGRHAGGLVLLFLGCWFLMRNAGMLPFGDRMFPASILVLVGFAFAISALLPRRGPGRL